MTRRRAAFAPSFKVFVVVFAAFALLLPGPARAAEDKPIDDEGFIRHWLILAPIPCETENNGAEEIDKVQVREESTLRPKPGDKVKAGDAELAWKVYKAGDFFFDVLDFLGDQTDNSVAYAVVYLDAPEEMKGLEMLVGSNDQCKVYLNGKEVFKFTETRTVDKDQDVVKDVTLNKGVNVIVFKVINENNNWAGALRFKSGDKPVTNLKVSTEPPKP